MKKYTLYIVLMLCAGFSMAQTFPTNFHKISRTSGDLSLTIGDAATFGIMTAGIGDLDNNGVLDIAVGAVSQDGFAIGAVFVLFMKADGTVDHMTEIQSSEAPTDLDSFASALTGLGDMDGDGVEDIGVGADYDSDGGFRAGAYWVLFMNSDGTVKSRKKISSTTGNFTTLQSEAQFGGGSTKLGDMDGDGVTEIAVGARNDNGSGAVYVLFMNTNGTVKSFKKITTGSGGLPLDGSGLFGYALSSLGDLDGDGISDLAIGAHRSDIGFVDSGVVWIVFLNANGTVKSYKKVSSGYSNFSDPTANLFGVGIAGLGDYDSDGHPDMVVGGEDGSGSGALWYMMLNADGTVKNYYKISGNSSNSNISLSAGDFFGGSLANIGDLDSDGVVDIASGAFTADDGGTNSGAVWVSVSSSKLNQNITFAALAPKAPNDLPFTLTATGGASGQPVTFTSSNTNVATVSGNTVTIIRDGATIITAHQVGNATYNPAPDVPRELLVNKVSQTITFISLPAKVFGDAAFSPGATASSGLTVSYASNNLSVAQISAGQVIITGAGSATITATQSGNGTYAAAPDIKKTLTVSKANQSITFGALPSKTYGDAPFTLTATSSSGLATTYTSSNTDVATVTGSEITINGAGSAVITAKQAGNTNYNPATDAPQTLTVAKANQSITFVPVTAKTMGDSPFNLVSTSSSSLQVGFSTTSDKVTISGSQVTIVKPGSVSISAIQVGNINYNSATQVSQTFCVNPAKPIVTSATQTNGTIILTSGSNTGNQWYRNGTIINGATSASYSLTESGTYTVIVTADNCSSLPSSDLTMVVTGDVTENASTSFILYPNPVGKFLYVKPAGFEESALFEVNIRDLQGKQAGHQFLRGAQGAVDVETLAAGIYLIEILHADIRYRAKFVKE